MRDAFICDGIRTPIGRYAGALSGVRADDLGAIPCASYCCVIRVWMRNVLMT